MHRLPALLLLCTFGLLWANGAGAATRLYVAPDGNDGWSGSRAQPNAAGTDGPLATLEKARDLIRAMKQNGRLPTGGVTVSIQAGVYPRSATFELGAEDSGAPGSPIVYRAADDARVRLLGGKAVSGFRPLTEADGRARLDPSAADKVLVSDLKAQGIVEYGTLKRRGFARPALPAGLELFFNGQPMTLARWPNHDWAKVAAVPSTPDTGKFTYEGERPDRWQDASDIWLHGYWVYDWADSFEHVTALDKAAKEMTTEAPYGVYGCKAGARYYVLNVLEELDEAGEWYLDRTCGKLYFWPPSSLDGAEVQVSLLETPLVVMKDASYVSFQGLSFECSRGPGLQMSGGQENRIDGCTFANLGNCAVAVNGGTHHGVSSCDLFNLGDGGISLVGGDRKTLTPCGHFAVNNHIHDYSLTVRTYTSAIQVGGVGTRVANNLIHDAPHMAIGLGGNDHAIEYNEVHHVCMETSDAGAFYMGRDWTQRGNRVRYNFFHEMGHGDVQAVYLDDWTSGVLVEGNVCTGALRGVLVGGGRDNIIRNNAFIKCGQAIHIDQRGLGWAKNYFDGTVNTLFDLMKEFNATQPPYSEHYPPLATILTDEPALAKGNVVEHNISYQCKVWLDLTDGLTESTPYLTFHDNFIKGDPGFVDADKFDFRLEPRAPARALGFKPLPLKKMGLYKDRFRTSLP